MEPIGIYRCDLKFPYEAGRQPRGDIRGEIILNPKQNFEQALEGIEGFGRLWLIFQFHLNTEWKPKVRPPRGTPDKIGVFATRSPYRPNSIGLSCVELLEVRERTLMIASADLLDGTPILDIKPYIPEADSFPESRTGWLEGIEDERHVVSYSSRARTQVDWLASHSVVNLERFLDQQLEFSPTDGSRKRVRAEGDEFVIAYRTWRARFSVTSREVRIEEIFSGYSLGELANVDDRWGDKEIHRAFCG